jgi:outer membrane protein assembly factor BamB
LLDQPAALTLDKPLRLWPGVIAAALLVLVRFLVPIVVPEVSFQALLGGLVFALLILVWWVLFSRAPWAERLGTIAVMAAALYATSRLVHVSMATGLLFIQAIPALSLALVAAACVTRGRTAGARRASIGAGILLVCAAFTLVRAGGVSLRGLELAWRWTLSPEERLMARAEEPTTTLPGEAAASTGAAAWPGFRGALRDGVVHGAPIQTDWTASPPVELWRRPVGPAWSSFAVGGGLLYTQEQRGDDEIVSCYSMTTGEPVWRHSDRVRFWEAASGAGPRATPTLSEGRVYTFGATGILNAIGAGDGAVVWSRDVASDAGMNVPTWGFSSSPLVVGDVVIVAAAGRLVAYDLATGDPRWLGPKHGSGYSSPHLLTIDGVAQVVLISGFGATAVAPADGAVLWEHNWPGGAIVQPAQMPDGDVLIHAESSGPAGLGLRRLAIEHGPGGWTPNERWTSTGLKPHFNDFVVHEGHAYGFDGPILSCIDLQDGSRKWKGGRYGNGQLLLLPDQDVLLVLSEDGDLALVGATPDGYRELARSPAIKGKTWNHPVLAGDVLLVRNAEEMAAFRLALAGN